ncbi:hypothetical protein VW29_04605 [Devosia limi DSM 17137]|uniref:Uncharacterized protein n=2 Tax=Devosia limi DSM 17137 TaxID=1121477 RepID=A0A0F5LV36_9HYPH|nr:hypothetical protein VW29_04605 [Devosia limi DSM 17137]
MERFMPINFRRHDTTARHLSEPNRQVYARLKSSLIASKVSQEAADEKLNAFFWQCFEDDEEDEDE